MILLLSLSLSLLIKQFRFAGTVDPLEGTASAEVLHNFRQELPLSLARVSFHCRALRELMMQPWVLHTKHTIRVRQFRLCLLVSCPQSKKIPRKTKTEMSPEV